MAYWEHNTAGRTHSILPIGTIGYYNQVELRRYMVEDHIPTIARFETWQGKKVLDLGCGLGTDALNFARCGAVIHAHDLSEEHLKHVRRRAKAEGLFITTSCGDAKDISALPTDFDLVWCWGVLHHIPDAEVVIERLRMRLRPGGKAIIMVYNLWSLRALELFWMAAKQQQLSLGQSVVTAVSRFTEAIEGCPYTHLYTARALRRLLCSFTNIKVYRRYLMKYNSGDYKRGVMRDRPLYTWLPLTFFHLLERSVGWHLVAEAIA